MGILRIPIVGQTAMLASHKMVINSWYPLALGRRSVIRDGPARPRDCLNKE